jgi:nitrile hydratase
LLSDANAALPEVGLSMGGGIQEQRLKVVENTATTHNVIVCTLCSCYPWTLLGIPPAWFKYPQYRARVVEEPRDVLREFGVELSDDVKIDVWDTSAEIRFLVIPQRPAGTDGMSQDELAKLVSRDAMTGVALAEEPAGRR